MNDTASTYEIRFDHLSVADASIKAQGLRQAVLEASGEAQAKIVKDDPSTMDFGATLILVLGAPAAVAVAKGISDYLRRVGGTVSITAAGGVETKGIAGADVAAIVKALSRGK